MSNNMENEDISISDFFKGKSIFITGGSGFIGKVIIEKLLRSCPDLKNIFVLLRPKRNASIEERIRLMTNVPLFDKLRIQNKNFMDKIIVVNGNIKELKLGISEEDRKRIIDNVSIIYNSAASVRFDDPLKDAVLSNVRSTREILNLAQELKTIDALVHLSTLYANADYKVIEEKVYPRHDWKDVITMVESCDESVLQVLTQKYIHPLPNTYTFTKSLAESIVNDYCDNKIPAVIARPSIVAPTGDDPFVGWVDNYNGPIGLNIAATKGILKTLYCDSHARMDYVFVDNVAKAVILATSQKSLEFRNQKKEVMVCNVSSNFYLPMAVNTSYIDVVMRNPPQTYIGSISLCHTKCWYFFFFRMLFLQIVPALFLDVLLSVCGKKLRILKIQRQIYITNMAVSQFLLNEWQSKNNNYLSLGDAVSGIDKNNFSYFHVDGKDGLDLIADECWQFAKVYLLNERPVATKNEVRRYRLFQLAANIMHYGFFGLVLYLVTWSYSIPTKLYHILYDYISNLDA